MQDDEELTKAVCPHGCLSRLSVAFIDGRFIVYHDENPPKPAMGFKTEVKSEFGSRGVQ
jgi:hypothetical protein